jgi:protein TonB
MFEASLAAARLPARSAGNGAILSLGTHALILAAVIAGARSVPPPQKIETPEVTFRQAPPPPPPPPLGGGAVTPTEAPRKPVPVKRDTYVPKDPARPAPAPDPAPATTAAGEPGGKEGGVPGGKEGGEVGGTPGGVIGSTGSCVACATADPPRPTTVVLPFGEGMNRPQRVGGPEPVYPREAREAKVEGTLLVKCVITTAGTLRGCRVLKSLPFLDQPVLEALAQQRYTPVTFQGRPVDVEYVIPFKFKLQ